MFFLLFVFTFECYCFAIIFCFVAYVFLNLCCYFLKLFFKGDMHKVRVKRFAIRKPKANKLIDVEVSDSSGAFTDDFEVEKYVCSADDVVEIPNHGSNVVVSIFCFICFCLLSSLAITGL